MQIGETVYIIRKHSTLYSEWIVVGQTSRSWVCVPATAHEHVIEGVKRNDPWYMKNSVTKFPKNGAGWTLGSKRGAELQKWVVANRYAIASRVQVADFDVVIAVARLVNFELPKEQVEADQEAIESRKAFSWKYHD